MGSWGHSSFENDGAQDWLAELVKDASLLADTLDAAANGDGYVDADDASAVLAAAEIIAAARGHGDERLDDDAAGWLATYRDVALAVDLELVQRAVERVWKDSELRSLWDDNGEDTEWHDEVRELRRRLRA